MKSGSLYLAAYDITENRERYRLSKVVEAFGVRIQKSAFELRLSRAQRETLLRQISALGLKSGWVALYRIDEAAKRLTAGSLPKDHIPPEAPCFVD
jgi:CRISPR-associated protein Cas2